MAEQVSIRYTQIMHPDAPLASRRGVEEGDLKATLNVDVEFAVMLDYAANGGFGVQPGELDVRVRLLVKVTEVLLDLQSYPRSVSFWAFPAEGRRKSENEPVLQRTLNRASYPHSRSMSFTMSSTTRTPSRSIAKPG